MKSRMREIRTYGSVRGNETSLSLIREEEVESCLLDGVIMLENDLAFVIDDETLAKVADLMKKFTDGEPKNINPLKEIPNSQMRLYGFSGAFMKSVFCDTEEELKEKIKDLDPIFGGRIQIFDYLGEVAGRRDVIRVTNNDGRSFLYVAVDEDGYGIYNEERSIYRGEFVWEYNYGNLREMYSAFRDKGIVFERDIYAEIDERYRRVMAMVEEDSHQVLTRKKD